MVKNSVIQIVHCCRIGFFTFGWNPQRVFRAPSRGENLSFLGVIGSVEKFPLVDLQFYFLIFKPEFTWNYDGI